VSKSGREKRREDGKSAAGRRSGRAAEDEKKEEKKEEKDVVKGGKSEKSDKGATGKSSQTKSTEDKERGQNSTSTDVPSTTGESASTAQELSPASAPSTGDFSEGWTGGAVVWDVDAQGLMVDDEEEGAAKNANRRGGRK